MVTTDEERLYCEETEETKYSDDVFERYRPTCSIQIANGKFISKRDISYSVCSFSFNQYRDLTTEILRELSGEQCELWNWCSRLIALL